MKYRKQIYLGFDASGKQIRKWISADTKAELKEKLLRFQMDRQQLVNPSEITFGKYAEQWFKTYKAHRAKQTQEMYKYTLGHCEDLRSVPIRKVTKSMCQQIVNDSWHHPSTAKNIVLTLKQIFKSAMADGIVASNPAMSLSLPKKPQSKFYLLTEEDLDKIEKAPLRPADRLLVTILKVFGLRPAEALALQPTDFDFRKNVLHITKAVELSNDNRSRIKSTKTEASRDIPIPEELIAPLRDHFRANPGFLLFPKSDGRPYTKSAYRRTSERILKAIGIPQMTLYSFRHRRATDLYYLTQTGAISTKKAAELMGHSEIVFLKTYSHIDESKENLDRIYDGLKVENL